MNKKKNKPALSGVERLIPELRFPEFEKEEEWEVTFVSNVCDVYRGSTFSKADMDENGSEPCIHYGELFTKYNEVISTIYSKTNKSDSFRSKIGDILMPSSDVTPDGLAKASAIMLDNVVLGGDMNILRPKKGFNSIFLSYLLNHSKREIIKLVSGTTVKHIYPSQIITSQLPIVNNKLEQQKIASCLSSLDEVITAHSQKLELLKDHKKGLMQNLFPQEGEKVPKYRFPEFEKDGEWVEKKLEKIAEVNPTSSQLPNEFVYIDLESVEKGTLLKRTIIEKEGAPSRAQRLLKNKDVIFQMVRPYQKNNYFFRKSNDFEYVASTGYAQLRAFESSMFLYQILHTDNFVSKVLEKCTGSNYPAINSSDLSKISVQIPKPTEQQKIASCLSSLDDLITAQTEKIVQLKEHKKGLMQVLFPKMIEHI